jgi:high-affinity nickel permease
MLQLGAQACFRVNPIRKLHYNMTVTFASIVAAQAIALRPAETCLRMSLLENRVPL